MISIIIPIYNVEDYLNKCIDSIIYQTYSDWELILVDDGSFDSSPAICDSYATCDSRIKVIHKINEGVSKARNIGIEIAQGEYIVFCDADDYVDPNYLKQFLKNNKNADLVITGYYFDTNNIVYSYKIYQEAYCKNLEEIKKHFFLQNLKSNGYPWGKFYKHEIIKSNHLRFNEHLQINEDHLFVFQYLLCCKTIYITPSKDYHYTVFRGNNIDSLKKATKIVFISEFAKQQILNHISLDESKMTVIPNPVDPTFKKSPKDFNQHKPRILHIGTLSRKNLNRSICALEGINCHLRIIGNIDETTKKLLLEKGIEYSCNSNLTHRQIVDEYCKADIINFPSLFEGFGMPIIEGQAIGRVVVTSNIPPMIDIAGDGAAIVDPYSVDSIHHIYSKIITDNNYRNNIITKGLKNAERFKVETIAKLYLNIYNQIEIEK